MKSTPLSYELVPDRHPRGRFGLLALEADATIEDEWRALLRPAEASFLTARVPCAVEITPESLRAMGARLEDCARTLVPGTQLDALAYACTSGTLMIGEPEVEARLQAACGPLPVTNPLTAAKGALRHLEVERVSIVTPYIDSVNEPLASHFDANGFRIQAFGSFQNNDDREVARISSDSIVGACVSLASSSSRLPEALFIACTGLRAAALVPRLEAMLGIPVTTSNHAMAWHVLALTGAKTSLPSRGTLFR